MTTKRRHLTLAVDHGAKSPVPKRDNRTKTYMVNTLLPRLPGERYYLCRAFVVRARSDREAAGVVQESGAVTELAEHVVTEVPEDGAVVLTEMEMTPKQATSLRSRVQTVYIWPRSRRPR